MIKSEKFLSAPSLANDEKLNSTMTSESEDNNFIDQDQKNIKKRKNPKFCNHIKWTKSEDNKLRELIKEFGENDWRHLAKKIENRNPRQCRELWQNYLKPDLNFEEWTQEEDILIFKKKDEIGPRWKLISTFFTNRTDQMIKNRYNMLVRYNKYPKDAEIKSEPEKIEIQTDKPSKKEVSLLPIFGNAENSDFEITSDVDIFFSENISLSFFFM